ncbi:hypothetical protein [Mycolicibacterium hippocampi]|uniref:Uncharacterized protein n=1 Tax=Mycolicibacterium hippocampi TaxID=659824 RepID=A0A7I9ZJF2_9MYCO|nr:hypothetical protein [Mycolicibacterium hippocampi]GFH00976.1 hypothetical protein MHIP_14590 [Mycolicibacterium hippocampi]
MKAWLDGVAADLELLAELFAEGDIRVVRDGADYYLTAPDIDNPPPDTRFHSAATARLHDLNGLARLEDIAFRPVGLSGKYTDGERVHHVVSPAPARLTLRMGRPKATITRADGTVVPDPPSPWPSRAELVASRRAVARVIRITARNEDLDWYDLYKIHEIIRDDIKSEDIGVEGWANKIEALGWATKAEDGAFTASADRYDISGEDARHAVDKHPERPKRTMNLHEGHAYIKRLAKRWMDYRIAAR